MPRPIINGTLGKVRKSIRTSFDTSSGLNTTVEWECAGDNLNGYARSLRDLGIKHDHTANGFKSSLIEFADGPSSGLQDIAPDRWEVLYNENQLDMREHPNFAALPEAQRGQVNKDVRRMAEGKQPARNWQSTGDYSGEQIAIAEAFYEGMIRGTSHYTVYSWVVRHTTNVSQAYTQNVADSGVGSIYTTAQLLSELGNSSYWTFPMPARLRTKIGNITSPTFITGLTWGWLKKPSNESSGANSRIDISTEYVLAQWLDVVYG
jgi:hypothetical protein